ncbi:hypothetical protein EDD63_1228 [Breznakia blatticola]|uniref:Permease n=1 Tax=Breznakia blatticola TaxID=1754012 RepID=A0A4R7ZHI4_9FIRM|nr:AEC family transporter [Breznakia blatticola]TDW16526.1 hypothetical protein EDD63_1228 [Breznakia blatticola]
MNLIVVASQMMKLFSVILFGYGVGKCFHFHEMFNQDLTKFVLHITMPLMIIGSVLSLEQITHIEIKDIAYSIVILVVILPIVSWIIIKNIPKVEEKGLIIFLLMYPNVGFMGFPVIQSILGKEALFNVAIINMAFNVSLFTIGQLVIGYQSTDKVKIRLSQLLSPGIIASLLAICIVSFQIEIPEIIGEVIFSIGDMTTPLAMITIGLTLSNYNIKKILCGYKGYLLSVIIDIGIPLLFYPLVSLLITDVLIRQITIIILSLPVANAVVLIAKKQGADELLATQTVLLSTLLSILTIPLIIYILL